MQAQKAANTGIDTFTTMYVTDMTQKEYSPVIGREKEVQRMVEILTRKNKSNPILVGDPGVGKTALVHGLVNLIQRGIVPPSLRNKKVYSIDLSLLGSDLSVMKYVLDEVSKSGDILFIDEIHNIVGAGKTNGSLDLANIMKPLLTDGSIMCIGATTPDEYMRYFEKDAALERRFSKVQVNEPDFDSCFEIISKSASAYEDHHQVKITKEAIEASINLSKKYITDRQLPDKAFDVLDEACSRKGMSLLEVRNAYRDLSLYESEGNWEKVSEIKYSILPKFGDISDTITAEDIAETVALKTSIPVSKLNQSESDKLFNLQEVLMERVIGQDEAMLAVANQIKASRVGMKDSTISMLLIGPSGVGKTETAKTVAQTLFNSEDALIRFDMSEFSEKHSVSKLIGSPAGYVGYEDGGQLTEAVRRNPYSVILFDEVEKAHPDVYDTLLQVLDDGILSDNKGRLIDFKNTIILMTSNLKLDEVNKYFKVEFINRIDEVVGYKHLCKEDLVKITHQKLIKMSTKIKQKNNILVDFSSTLVAKVVDMAYKPEYGARELDRIIHKLIQVPLTDKILQKELEEDRMYIFNK